MLLFEDTLLHRCSTNSLGVRPSFHLKCFHTRAALKKTEALNAEISEMEKRAKDAGLWNTSLGSKMKDLEEESATVWVQIETGHRKHRELLNELEVRKEEKVELLGNRYAVKENTMYRHYLEVFNAFGCEFCVLSPEASWK